MNGLYVTRLDHASSLINQIPLDYARSSLYGISGVLFVLVAASFIRHHRPSIPLHGGVLFVPGSTLMFKGLAIILLLLGHVSQQCVVGSEALPFRNTGNAAVIIFLFMSGVGLAKKYQLQVDQQFWQRRLSKLALPIWLTLVLVLPLNYFLIGHTDPSGQLILNFLGVFWTKFPNSPCWFITYILLLYAMFRAASLVPVKSIIAKLSLLFFLSFAAACIIIATGSIDHFVLWPQYSLVFPAGVLCGLHGNELKKIIDTLFRISPFFYIAIMFLLLGIYWTGFGVYRISHLVSSEYFTQLVSAVINPLPFLLFFVFCIGLLEMKGWSSDLLKFLGKYSFEMYLLHFPFMVYYDFFLFRRPLVFFFFVYALLVIGLSVLLQRTVLYLEKHIKIFPVMAVS